MNVQRQFIRGNELSVPAIQLIPKDPVGAALIVHGFGGCKEEQLGLAWRVAETGLTTCVIDLRGHGENELSFDEMVVRDVETAIDHCRRFGKVVAIGHSLGGRLSLTCQADYGIGISPALYQSLCLQTQENLNAFKRHRVRGNRSPEKVFEKLPEWPCDRKKPGAILYGTRDSKDIIQVCRESESVEMPVVLINQALHGDIFVLEETFATVKRFLKTWFRQDTEGEQR